MQIEDFAMSLALGMIQFAPLVRGGIGGIGKAILHFRRRQAAELREKFGAALANLTVKFSGMIGKEQKRARGAEFLALKKHGRAGSQQHQSSDGAEFAGRSQ